MLDQNGHPLQGTPAHRLSVEIASGAEVVTVLAGDVTDVFLAGSRGTRLAAIARRAEGQYPGRAVQLGSADVRELLDGLRPEPEEPAPAAKTRGRREKPAETEHAPPAE